MTRTMIFLVGATFTAACGGSSGKGAAQPQEAAEPAAPREAPEPKEPAGSDDDHGSHEH